MKPLFFITFLLIFSNIFGQTNNTPKYYVDKYTRNPNSVFFKNETFFDSSFLYHCLVYIETFKNDTDCSRLNNIMGIFKEIGINSNKTAYSSVITEKIKYKTINFLLDIYRYPLQNNKKPEYFLMNYFDKSFYDEKAVNKMKKLCDGNFSQSEIQKINNFKILTYIDFLDNDKNLQKKISELTKSEQKTFKEIKDSIYSVKIHKFKTKLPNKIVRYPDKIIFLAGKYKLKPVAPVIEKYLNTVNDYPEYISKIVLARFGNEKYINEITNELKSINFGDLNIKTFEILMQQLMFISNKKSLEIIIKNINIPYCGQTYDNEYIKIGYEILYHLQFMINNLPDKFKILPVNLVKDCNSELLTQSGN